MDKKILHVVDYFSHFAYPPTVAELNLFLNNKATLKQIEDRVRVLVNKKVLVTLNKRYSEDLKIFKIYKSRRNRSLNYFHKASTYLSWTSSIPAVQLVGVSGSLSMMNMTEKGDIDIFIITKANFIWQTRFILLLYKYYLKIIYPDIGNKLCFNLFFADDGMKISQKKQNEYIGHEVLQLKPIVNKNFTYEKFLSKNSWIVEFFPNVQISLTKMKVPEKLSKQPFYSIFIEQILKEVQVFWLKIKNIKWHYSKGQLWLIQEDFEKRLGKGQ